MGLYIAAGLIGLCFVIGIVINALNKIKEQRFLDSYGEEYKKNVRGE